MPRSPKSVTPIRYSDAEFARLEAFISCTADAVIGFDTAGLINFWNKSAERIFGYAAEEAIGQSYTMIATQEVHAFQHRIFSETIKGDTHKWYDTQRRRKDGTVIDCAITTSPLTIDGKIEGLVAIVRDITEKVKAAEELKESHARLDAIARQLAEANRQLEATAEDKRQFVNMVLHDLRHPLTTIQIVLYLLRKAEEAEREEHVAAIEGRVSALVNLLNELTDYHRIEAGHDEIHLEPVHVQALLLECVENFKPALIGGQVQIEVAVQSDLGIVQTDGSKLNHIAMNLLSNALKFTPKGKISVSAAAVGDAHWALSVADTGMGMVDADRDRVFEAFYQEEKEKGRKRGFGLGLSIAKRLCESLGGEIEIRTEFGTGTSFRLLFPRTISVL